MAEQSYPSKYLLFNSQQTKTLALVVQIEGVDNVFTTVPLFTRVRYGDPGIYYGQPGLIYGGLRALPNVKSYLTDQTTMTISQRIEPEQGRGSVSTMNLVFIDKDGYMSKVISPGVIVDEPLGNKEVKCYLGFQGTSFPEDFFVVFRGFISQTNYQPGKVQIQLSDPNAKRRQQVGFSPTTQTTSALDNSQTTIPVNDAADFFQQILGPNGGYDSTVKTYIKIDDEVMEYGPTGLTPSVITVTRGARGTTADAHDIASDVSNTIEISGNGIDIALKLMMSGWNGPYLMDLPVASIVNTLDPLQGNISNAVVLTADAVLDYGIAVGAYVTIAGSTMGNDGTYIVVGIGESQERPNRIVFVDTNLTVESPATGVTLSVRSQYDTYPEAMGSKLLGQEVDIARHVSIRNNFLSQGSASYRFYITEPFSAKTFIESEICLPFGLYSITRFGAISLNITKPPIADERLQFITANNLIEPESISMMRGINSRRFFNEVQYFYDADDNGSFQSRVVLLDTESLSKITISSILPINSKGLRTDLGAPTIINNRGTFLLNRYKNTALELQIKTNWEVGSLIETGDIVAVQDDGTLHIINFRNGSRNLETGLFEVIDRQLDVKNGNITLKLLQDFSFQIDDRFATISPSSNIIAGSTTSQIKIEDSYGSLYPLNEKKKWENLEGNLVTIHDILYTDVQTTTFTGFSPTDKYLMLLDPPLATPPPAGYVVDISDYPTSTLPSDGNLLKLLFAHIDPTILVATGISNTQFTVAPGDVATFFVGSKILIHDAAYNPDFSPEVVITDITGVTITVDRSLTFTPSAGEFIELIGFPDHGGAYRII